MTRDGLEEYTGEGRVTLQVAAQIIARISSGLYRSPESALKELVSNSFDADASEVRIQFIFSKTTSGKETLSRVVIRDNGMGMNIENLKYVFTHVGGSLKERSDFSKDPTTPGGRPLIGRLGIGMLSIASACEVFRVKTKKKGDNREYLAEINLEYLKDIEKSTQSMDVFSIGNVGLFSKSVTDEFSQYTEVEISQFTPPFMESIQNQLENSFIYQNGKILEIDEGKSNEAELEAYFIQLLNWLLDGGKLMDGSKVQGKTQLQSAHPLDIAVINLGLMCPVQYLSDGPIRSEVTVKGVKYMVPGTDDPSYLEIKNRYHRYHFSVIVELYREYKQGERFLRSRFKIYKPLLYPRQKDLDDYGFEALSPRVYPISPLKSSVPIDENNNVETELSGYYYYQNRRIKPQEFRGILYRVYNVAIGTKFLDDIKLWVTNSVILWQSLSEIYLDKGFQRIVNLDRESLYEGNNVYRHLRYFLENFLIGTTPEKLSLEAGLPTSVVERKFSKIERELFQPKEGLISKIRRSWKGSKKEGEEDPWDAFKRELLFNEGATRLSIIGRTNDPSKISVTKVGKSIRAVLPEVEQDKMWDAIFINLYFALLNKEPEIRKQVFSTLLSIYKEWHER